MSRQILDEPVLSSGRPEAPEDASRVCELELRILQLEEEKARLERERLEYELMGKELVGRLDSTDISEMHCFLHDRQQHAELLRNGRVVPVHEVPPEAIMDIAELIFWRHALAEATGLQTFLFIQDEGEPRSAGNSPSQLPALAGCEAGCRLAVEQTIVRLAPDMDGPTGARCGGCGRPLWAVPVFLRHGREKTPVAYLIGHDLPSPTRPYRRMIELVANLAGRRASEAYAQQVNTILQMQVTAMIAKYVEQKTQSACESQEILERQSSITADLAKAKLELETALDESSRAKRRAERSNVSKSMFLAAMSHEIRTPLTCVIGFADLLGMPALTMDEARRFAASIKESGQVLLSLINNVLDLSRIESGCLDLEHIPFSVRRVMDEVGDIFTPSCLEKGITLRAHTDEDVPEEQLGDPTRLRQVLMNLVGNALKFTREGGIEINCSLDPADSTLLVVQVRDTGPGISSDRLEAIFEAFRQAEADTVRKHGGSGLGLAISRRIVEVMGGDLTVESREGEGSCFTFFFKGLLRETITVESG